MISDREDRVRTAAKRVGLTLAAIQGEERKRFRLLCLVNGNRLTNPDDPDRGDMFTLDLAQRMVESISRTELLDFENPPGRSRRGDGKAH